MLVLSERSNSYVTVKDHKTDFLSNPKCRLINGTNQEISRISQKALKEIIRKIKIAKQYQLWENSRQALNWFEKERNHLRRECDSCDYVNNHTESIHDKTKHFKCDECNYKTTKCDGLKEHVRTVHQKVKKFKCKICNFAANKCCDLNKHMNSKHQQTFVQLDVSSMYPSITKSLLDEALKWAQEVESIEKLSKDEIDCIYAARESLIFVDGAPWEKKESNFDVSMGSGDGAEICELIDLFIIYQITEVEKLIPKEKIGAFRDDYLAITGKSKREMRN